MSTREPIRHILVAHDLASASEAALDFAVALAKPLGARVTVLHTYEIPPLSAPEVLGMSPEWFKQIAAGAQEALSKVVDRVKSAGPPVTSELRQGVVWREVDAAVKAHQVDLVVVGSHGRRGLPRALLGSVAEKIVRTAPCPVVVVRGPEHEG
jgi:nucleotide-binding universal stress UspA family protein